MIETHLSIIVNRKEDIDIIEAILREQNISAPIKILEFEDYYDINFSSDYEEWEIENAIVETFSNYHFVEDLGKGRKEIRIKFSREQSRFSTDNWGRPLEDPINQTKYLVKESKKKVLKFSPQIKVLFENFDEYYFVNIVPGIDKVNDKKGYLVLNEFREFNKDKETDFLKEELYSNKMEAFKSGVNEIEHLVQSDFQEYLEAKKKKRKKK